MTTSRLISYIVAIALGILMFLYGGYDDSPGGQLLGLVLVALGVAGLIRGRRK